MVINMGKYVEKSIAEKLNTTREIVERIFDNALSKRKKTRVSYRPYRNDGIVNMSQRPGVDFAAVYPYYKKGDYAFMETYLDGLFEREMLINIRGTADAEVWFNGEKLTLGDGPNGTQDTYANFRKGENHLIVKAAATDEGFSVYAYPLVPKIRYGTGGDYAYCTWQYIKKDGFRLQEGASFSKLYKKGEIAPDFPEIEWVYPMAPEETSEKEFDFNALCKKGCAAYAYTYIKGNITIFHNSPIKIFSGEKVLYNENAGVFEGEFKEETPILIKSLKNGDAWGFSAVTDGVHTMPPVDGADTSDLCWMWTGPFGREGEGIDYPYGPEKSTDLVKPYHSAVSGTVYWNFYRKDTYLRQYLYSAFFGKWFYAIFVGMYGLKRASQILGRTEFDEYFSESMRLIALHRDYGEFDNKKSGYASYLASGGKMNSLDDVGAVGMNMSEYYLMSNDAFAGEFLNRIMTTIKYKVPRFPDGTFYRIKTMWTDDMFMCLPIMVRLGAILGDEAWYDDILCQVRGYEKRLYMADKDLFSHIYFPEEDFANRVPWCRGNGWVLLALSEVLMFMPEDFHGREEILALFRKFSKGVLSFRDRKEGIWHQVIDNAESYIETSGSAMFITALARGINNGWISEEYKDDVKEAWSSLCRNCIDENGDVYGICMGSGCNKEEKYYLKLQTIENDDHGVGVVLTAGTEILKMEGGQ